LETERSITHAAWTEHDVGVLAAVFGDNPADQGGLPARFSAQMTAEGAPVGAPQGYFGTWTVSGSRHVGDHLTLSAEATDADE
jgi:hypothetical protein